MFFMLKEYEPSAWLFGKDGNKSGMSSAESPSTESTTDFGRNFLPCKLFRLFDKCGVAYVKKKQSLI